MKKRLALIVPMVLAAVLAFAGPALALTYGSKASPIKAENNSDAGNAWFYGTMSVRSGIALRNAYHFRDSAPGGNSAFVTTRYYWYQTCNGSPNTWCDLGGADRSSETTSGDWLSEADEHTLEGSGDRGRMESHVCENQAWAPDDCSKNVLGTFSY